MPFVERRIVLGSADVNPGLRGHRIAPLEHKELANLLQAFANRPCREWPSHACSGVGNVHAVTGCGNGGRLAAFMGTLLLNGLVLLGLVAVFGFNRNAIGIGLDQHGFSAISAGEGFARVPHSRSRHGDT